MQFQHTPNFRAPLLSWDFFCSGYNSILEDAAEYRKSVSQIKQIARVNHWNKDQIHDATESLLRCVVIITDPLHNISFAGRGFYKLTGYAPDEAIGKNPNFLQGPATNKLNTALIKERLAANASAEIILENYRLDGELYLCKILIKPVVNINQKLVNYIAYEQEIAA